MGRQHGSKTVVLINGTDLSQWLDDSDWNRDPEKQKVTTYGKGSNVYDGGIKDGTTQLSFLYDTSQTTGPQTILEPLEGTVATMIYRPEGTGVGKRQRTVNAFIGQYKETHPVGDFVRGTLQIQHSDDVSRTIQ